MSGVSTIEIHETAQDLWQLMKEQKQLRQRSPAALRSLMRRHEMVEALAWAGMPPFLAA